jgi:LPXTG-motif cell wall-anchored protein
VLGALLIGSGTASAQSADDYTAQPPAVVAPASANKPATAAPTAVKGASAKAASSDLPVTGTDVITLAAIGGGLVLAGGAVLVSRRRLSQA